MQTNRLTVSLITTLEIISKWIMITFLRTCQLETQMEDCTLDALNQRCQNSLGFLLREACSVVRKCGQDPGNTKAWQGSAGLHPEGRNHQQLFI